MRRNTIDFSRRTFLQGSAALGAGLVIGFDAGVAQPTGGAVVNNWLRVAPDNRITLFTSVQEMGQGAWGVHAQIVAEELDLDWSLVNVEQAPLAAGFGSYWTGGSSSVRRMFDTLRKAGAAARVMLVEAAAERWGAARDSCSRYNGFLVQAPSGRRARFGERAVAAARRPVPENPPLKPRGKWRLIGKDVPRADIPMKVDGSLVYATDIDLPGLLTATILQAPVFGAKLKNVDPAPAMAVKGVRQVVTIQNYSFKLANSDATVTLPDAVVVVADGFWQAKKGLEALQPEWEAPAGPLLDTDGLARQLFELSRDDDKITVTYDPNRPEAETARMQAAVRAGADAAFARSARVVDADYQLPLLAHAQMEPLSAVARVTADGAEIWSGTQNASGLTRVAGGLLGIDPANVRVHVLMSGGAFGRRYKHDFTSQALYIARAVGAPVKLIWTREEDMRQGWYRPAANVRLRAALGADNELLGMRINVASAGTTYARELVNEPGTQSLLYELPALAISGPTHQTPVPCGPWRSVPHTVNAFAIESFVDELALSVGSDPLAYRRRLLSDNPRALRVLDTIARKVNWAKPLPKGRGRGLAVWRSFGSLVGQVAEVSASGAGLKIDRIVCVIDCGTAVNPDSIRAQGEGSIIMALTAALNGEISLEGGRVVEGNFDGYPMLLMDQVPPIEIEVIDSPDAPIGGAGEPMTPPLAAALANAVFAATGKRLRALPLAKQGITLV